jgi:hypothetical protein
MHRTVDTQDTQHTMHKGRTNLGEHSAVEQHSRGREQRRAHRGGHRAQAQQERHVGALRCAQRAQAQQVAV